jgi:hypothetical protein
VANPWFRLYSEFADDPKVQVMSEAMQRRLIMLMCSRCKEESIPESLRAFQWRITQEELEETKRVFVANGFIDEKWRLANWSKRQFISDSSTDRTRRYRERHETSQERHGDGDVTKCDALDTDTDTEQIQIKKQKKQKPPRDKRESDPRPTLFQACLVAYWAFANSGIEMPWGPGEAGQLGKLLRESPHLTCEQFKTYLYNRHLSDGVNTAERPMQWLPKISSYAGGPLNQFQQPKNGSNGYVSKAEQRTSHHNQIARDIIAETNEDLASPAPREDPPVVPSDDSGQGGHGTFRGRMGINPVGGRRGSF